MKGNALTACFVPMCRLEEHVEWTGPETLRKFDKRMAAATDGLREGLNWGELVNAGGSPAPLLALHTSHPTEQVSTLLTTVCTDLSMHCHTSSVWC